jgi:hypothetical protein
MRSQASQAHPDGSIRTVPSEVSANSAADGADVITHAQFIRDAWSRSARAILATAALVFAAWNALDHTGFRRLAKLLGWSHGTLSKFVTIHSACDRFEGREETLPSAWTVVYQVAKLPDAQFKTLAASGKLRPELSEKEVRKFSGPHAALASSTRTAADELAYVSVRVVFPALLSPEREDAIRKQIFAAVGNDANLTVTISQRKKVRPIRG